MATIRVFVDGRAVDVAPAAQAIDAVRALDADLAAAVVADRRRLMDSRGLPMDPSTPLVAGSIVRLVASRSRGAAADAPDA